MKEKLYAAALKYAGLTGNEIEFDAYCGTGTISLFLSQNAKINAAQNKVTNAELIVGKSVRIGGDFNGLFSRKQNL